jgi:hypothetical protein
MSDAQKRQFLGENAYRFIEELLPEYERAPIFQGA